MAVTKLWKVYGADGHRQKESFHRSVKYDFSTKHKTRIIEINNSDKTGTNDYSIIKITRDSLDECDDELRGQLSDGVFENCRNGKVVEISPILDLIKMAKPKNVYVGSKSNFLYAGPSNYFVENIDYISDDVVSRFKDVSNKYKRIIDRYRKNCVTEINAIRYKEVLDNAISNFIPLKNRAVIKSYWSIRGKNDLIIIIEGNESGMYATIGEYRNYMESKGNYVFDAYAV